MTDWPFDPLAQLRYGVILADPPWHFRQFGPAGYEKNPAKHYDCMDLEAIKRLPVDRLAGPDALLFMWAIWPMLPQALDLMAAWGFTFKTGGTWAKQSKTGEKWAFGTGYVFRGACEPFIVGTIGQPTYASRSERNLIVAPVREHSRKPDDAHAMLERLCPTAWRCELFARQPRAGWDVWGNETDKFAGDAA